MWYVGIDIAKRKHEAIILDAEGKKVCAAFSLENSKRGLDTLIQKVEKYCGEIANATFAMEATGHYWLPIYTHLRGLGAKIYVMNPMQSDALRGLYIRQCKNDAKDAMIIAEIIRIGRSTNIRHTDPDLMALREMCRHRFFLSDMVGGLKQKVVVLLDQLFPEYERLFSDIFGKTSTQLLKEFTTPDEMAAIPTQDLCQFIKRASRGRFRAEKAREIQEAAQNTFGVMLISDTLGLLVRQLLEQIEMIEKQIAVLETQIAEQLKPFNSALPTIPGIGPFLAAVILSEIGDITHFESAAKLAAFAGVDPTQKQSGESTGGNGHMSKRGSSYLRRALWLASFASLRANPSMRAFYDRKIGQGKHHCVAMGHLCRKMVSIIFAVMRENKPFILPELA